MTQRPQEHELRDALREVIAAVIREEMPQLHARDLDTPIGSSKLPSRRPAIRSLDVTLTGSGRSIGLIEEALRAGSDQIQVTIAVPWGPSVRVKISGS